MDLSPWDIREGEIIRLILANIKVNIMASVFCGGRRAEPGVSKGINEEA